VTFPCLASMARSFYRLYSLSGSASRQSLGIYASWRSPRVPLGRGDVRHFIGDDGPFYVPAPLEIGASKAGPHGPGLSSEMCLPFRRSMPATGGSWRAFRPACLGTRKG